MSKENQKYIFHVDGIHCKACVMLIEDELSELESVKQVAVDLKNSTVEIVGDFSDKTHLEVAEELTKVLSLHGYKLTTKKEVVKNKWSDFVYAVPIAFGFILLFIYLQKAGIINLIDTSNVDYGTAFLIGVVASVSTCMAVVGGIVLSMSATFAKEGGNTKTQIMFHAGRLISFFVFGGIIGLLGLVFTLSSFSTFVLSLIVGLIMLILGINLLDIFDWSKRFQPSMPKFITTRVQNLTRFNNTTVPFLLGVATFFLPCGFTQSMQLYTLTAGGFWEGAFTMTAFALGTLPVLALISFSSFRISHSAKSGIFFKSAGLIVIMFALFNLINSLVVMGIISPVFNY